MINEFKTRLTIQAALYSRSEILGRMGYKRPSPANFARLENVLKSDACGLDQSGFDFRFSAEAFLLALCEAVRLEDAAAHAFIAMQKHTLEEERSAFKPWIWVDTGFVRASQPIFALAACEHLRRIELPKGTWRLSTGEQLSVAATAVRKHYNTNQGVLGIWGNIEQYWFCYGEDDWHLLNCEGGVASKSTGSIPKLSLAKSGLQF
ncbi:MAG: hypothetical protein V7772_07855 [Pseudomonas profundi]|uniref:hypothetical protein n=1 Tax=Pseudomonas profundi TaxID=1981513 RepID=UPI0030033198